MAYSAFTNLELKKQFGVEQAFYNNLFTAIPPHAASERLLQNLTEGVPFALIQGSEKARSEFIIAPVMLELKRQAREQISIFSGMDFTVAPEQGLNGVCDFLISRSPYQADIEAPVVVTVEAKQDDFRKGTTQCIAEMIAARLFNEQQGRPINEIYGCVTTGDVWRFLVLRGQQAMVETTAYDIREDLERILGILLAMSLNQIPPATSIA